MEFGDQVGADDVFDADAGGFMLALLLVTKGELGCAGCVWCDVEGRRGREIA